MRVRARYAGGIVTGWGFGSGTPEAPVREPIKLTPNSDFLTGLTFNDGVRDLPIKPVGSDDVIGLGGPEYKYYVYVPPGVRSVTVTPTWTNSSITGIHGDGGIPQSRRSCMGESRSSGPAAIAARASR